MNGHLLSHKCPPLPPKTQRVLRKKTVGARGQWGSLWYVTFWKWQGHCAHERTLMWLSAQVKIPSWTGDGLTRSQPYLRSYWKLRLLWEGQSSLGVCSLRGCPTFRHIRAAPIGLSFLFKKHKTRDWRDAMAIKSTYCSLECSGSTQRLHKAAHNCKPAPGTLETLAFPGICMSHLYPIEPGAESTTTTFLN